MTDEAPMRDRLVDLIRDRMMSSDHAVSMWEIDFANAILKAMRDDLPQAMLRQGGQEYAMTFQRPHIAESCARDIWRAMIDAAFPDDPEDRT